MAVAEAPLPYNSGYKFANLKGIKSLVGKSSTEEAIFEILV